jgi:hypothetical protein
MGQGDLRQKLASSCHLEKIYRNSKRDSRYYSKHGPYPIPTHKKMPCEAIAAEGPESQISIADPGACQIVQYIKKKKIPNAVSM